MKMEELNKTKLRQFDLEKDLEIELLKSPEKQEGLFHLIKRCSQIFSVNQFIFDLPSRPDLKKDIINQEINSSVGATLAIEGIVLDEEETSVAFQKLDIQAKIKNNKQQKTNTDEVYYNYIPKIAREQQDYSEEQIKTLHYKLTDNVICVSPNVPGKYRDTGALITGKQPVRTFFNTTSEIIGAMRDFVGWLKRPGEGPLTKNPIIKALMAHYYLVAIHPFGDGNGRTARALEALILYKNLGSGCYSNLAQYWSNNREEYIINLGHIKKTLNPMDFLMFGVEGYLEEAQKVKGQILKKVKQLMLKDYIQGLCLSKQISTRIFYILEHLITLGKTPYKEFQSIVEPIQANIRQSSKYKDFHKMKALKLIHILVEDGKKYIEPNFEILEELKCTI